MKSKFSENVTKGKAAGYDGITIIWRDTLGDHLELFAARVLGCCDGSEYRGKDPVPAAGFWAGTGHPDHLPLQKSRRAGDGPGIPGDSGSPSYPGAEKDPGAVLNGGMYRTEADGSLCGQPQCGEEHPVQRIDGAASAHRKLAWENCGYRCGTAETGEYRIYPGGSAGYIFPDGGIRG